MRVADELANFVVTELAWNQDLAAISPQDNLLEAGLIDSMGIVKLSMFMEQEFGIRIADEDLVPENFETLERLTTFVESRQTGR